MFNTRKIAVALLLSVVMLTVSVAAAPAAGTTSTSVTTDAPFTIAAGQCPNLPAGQSVSGTGKRTDVTTTTVRSNGSTYTTIDLRASGTATGSDGTKYTFYYGNFFAMDSPADGGKVKAKMYDLFLLSKVHGASGYVLKNGFVWKWTFLAGADPFAVWPPTDFQKLLTFGDPISDLIEAHCDPL